ncbi:MAG: DUF6788 family protein [Pseudomonadota bacterium]
MEIAKIENDIAKIKRKILDLGDMRPGSLSKQMRRAKKKYGAYWQLSYTHMGKGRTEYIKPETLKQVKTEVANYKRYRNLSDQLVQLSIEKSRLKAGLGKET